MLKFHKFGGMETESVYPTTQLVYHMLVGKAICSSTDVRESLGSITDSCGKVHIILTWTLYVNQGLASGINTLVLGCLHNKKITIQAPGFLIVG